MIGYVQLYIKVEGEYDTYYALLDSDFGKPLTRRALWEIRMSFAKAYRKFGKVHRVSFCTKTEYEMNNSGDQITKEWGNVDT